MNEKASVPPVICGMEAFFMKYSSMRFYAFFIFIVFLIPWALFNSFLYFESCFFGTLIFAFLWIPLNAFFPTFFNPIALILIVFSVLHDWKA